MFRHDLRLTDNLAFEAIAARCERMVCVYIIENDWFELNQYQCQTIGTHRQKFLGESLINLDENLKRLGQSLHVIKGDFINLIADIIEEIQPAILGLHQHCGWNEQRIEKQLEAMCDANQVEFSITPETSLFNRQQLPFSIESMPDVFSPFRRKVEKSNLLRNAVAKCHELPGKVSDFDYNRDIDWLFEGPPERPINHLHSWERQTGGESSALEQLDYYLFETDLIANYKQTRNQLDGWDFSSKLSLWLANGSISPATVSEKIKQYEQSRIANDSTYWLIFELLWREFFHLQSYKHGLKLFSFSGIQNKTPTTKYDTNTYRQWCHGETGYPIVDACMRQLNATGFMSNRGRQLVASCFVHELNLDWRYGAAYFEQQLIDYDVACNWGNWQYLAGVGSDPRGHRRFNLAKQTEIYDPEGEFINRWLDPEITG